MTTQVTYGNIRKPTRPGLWGMSTVQTGVVVLSMFVLIFLAATGNMGLILAWVSLVVLFSVPLLIPTRDGRNVYQRTHARWVFDRSRRRARNIYKAGPTGHVADGKCRLPGLLAASELTEHRDAYDQPFGLLGVPATKHYSVVLEANATGNELVDLATVDQQVAHWGAWLAALGNETGIAGASVTVETAPDSGLRLRRNVEDNVADEAPEFGLAVLSEDRRFLPGRSGADPDPDHPHLLRLRQRGDQGPQYLRDGNRDRQPSPDAAGLAPGDRRRLDPAGLQRSGHR